MTSRTICTILSLGHAFSTLAVDTADVDQFCILSLGHGAFSTLAVGTADVDQFCFFTNTAASST